MRASRGIEREGTHILFRHEGMDQRIADQLLLDRLMRDSEG